MEFDHRKLLTIAITRRDKDKDDDYKKKNCSLDIFDCKKDKDDGAELFHGDMIRRSILIAASIVTAFFFLCLAIMIAKRYLSHRRRLRDRLRRPIHPRGGDEIFIDEERGDPMTVDHPIWYINTVGLPRHVIDSIAVVKHGKDAGFVDCSVCLSEFEEDESVRVLPKCDHAFHVECIDTWLASHKSCPLCRAPIVCENAEQSVESGAAEEVSPAVEAEEGESSRARSDSVAGEEEELKRGGSNGGMSIYRQVMSMRRSISMKRPSSSSSSSSSLSISKHRRTQSSIVPS